MIDFCVRGEKFSSDENLARGESNQDSTGRGIMSQQTVTKGSRGDHGLCWSLDEIKERDQGSRFDIRCWLETKS